MGATKEENGLQWTSLIKEEREAKWADDNPAEKMRGDAAQDQRVLAAPRVEGKEESIVEMVQRLTIEIDKEMGTPIWNLEPSTQLTTPKKKKTREVQQVRQPENFLSQLETEKNDYTMPRTSMTLYKEG